MKYCTSCGASRESWVDKGYTGTNYDSRCWSCDNFTLTPSSQSLIRAPQSVGSSEARDLARRLATDPDSRASVNYRDERGNLNSGNYYCEILQADKSSYHYKYVEYKRK